jgi:CO/xanthine dehydrogenase FAD-binding subunit
MLRYDNYFIPKTLKEYFELTSKVKDCRIVAGCTDILPWAREGRGGDVFLKNVVDVSRIKELNTFKFGSKKILMGAATNYQKLFMDKKIRKDIKILPQVSVWFADDQIREQATIGGNIVNASPAGDGSPAFLTLNAQAIIMGRKGKDIYERKISLDKFILGRNKVDLQGNEILAALEMDNTKGYGASFEKVGHRRSLVISTVCVSCVARTDSSGKLFDDVRIAVAGVREIPCRLEKTEQFLQGKEITEQNILQASVLDLDVINARSRLEYRKEVLQNFIIRAIIKSVSEKIIIKENYFEKTKIQKLEEVHA